MIFQGEKYPESCSFPCPCHTRENRPGRGGGRGGRGGGVGGGIKNFFNKEKVARPGLSCGLFTNLIIYIYLLSIIIKRLMVSLFLMDNKLTNEGTQSRDYKLIE